MNHDDLAALTDDELDALLRKVWPAIREQVWLSLPRPMRWAPFRADPNTLSKG